MVCLSGSVSVPHTVVRIAFISAFWFLDNVKIAALSHAFVKKRYLTPRFHCFRREMEIRKHSAVGTINGDFEDLISDKRRRFG